VERQPLAGIVRIGIDAVEALGVEGGGPPDDAVDLVALLDQQLGEVGAVLPGDSSDQRTPHRTPRRSDR